MHIYMYTYIYASICIYILQSGLGNVSHPDNHPRCVVHNLMSHVGTEPTSMGLAKQQRFRGTHATVPTHTG